MANIWQSMFAGLSGGGPMGRLSILIFHRVLSVPDPLFPEIPDSKRFEEVVGWVREWFNVLPLCDAVEKLQSGTLPARPLCITFDDGYADNVDVALPILRRQGVTATFFVASGMLDGGRMWNDTVIESVRNCKEAELDLRKIGLGVFPLQDDLQRRRAIDATLAAIKRLPVAARTDAVERISAVAGGTLPDDLMMRSEQLRVLIAAGMDVGAHTATHPILARLPDADALDEMARSRAELQQVSGTPIRLFAYPNGVPGVDYDVRHVDMARRCGFAAAFSTAWGVSDMRSDRFQLPRFTPWDRGRFQYAMRLALNLRRRAHAVV